MRDSELLTVDGDLFTAYVARFGMFDTFCAPPITAGKLESLMKEALLKGEPIPYAEEGWDEYPDTIVV